MNFHALSNEMYTVTDIFAERQCARGQSWFERTAPRPTEALLLFTNSTAIYRSSRKPPLYVPHGALVYIPRGHIYNIETHCIDPDEQIEVLLFEFNLRKNELQRGSLNQFYVGATSGELLQIGSDQIELIDLKSSFYRHFFHQLIDSFEDPHAAPISVYHDACAILDCLVRNHSNVLDKPIFAGRMEQALEELGSMEQPEKSVQEIAELCKLSLSGFEKAMKRLTGMTPVDYRMACKIAMVKDALLEQPDTPLEILAEQFGFGNSAYLCRVFKKQLGVTPRQYARSRVK